MIEIILPVVSGILSYLFGSFGSTQWYHPGVEQILGQWKLLFAFIAAAGVFLSKDRVGFWVILALGVISAIGFALNYKSFNAIPPILPATHTSWFFFQLAQSCAVGVGVRLIAELGGLSGRATK